VEEDSFPKSVDEVYKKYGLSPLKKSNETEKLIQEKIKENNQDTNIAEIDSEDSKILKITNKDFKNLEESTEKNESLFCMECGANLPERAKFCPSCGTQSLSKSSAKKSSEENIKNKIISDEIKINNSAEINAHYNSNRMEDVRAGNTQAKFNEEASGYLLGQILLISILFGGLLESWIAGGFALIYLLVIAYGGFGETYQIVLLFSLSLFWAIVGWTLGDAISGFGAALVISFFAFICSWGFNEAGIKYLQDLNRQF